jgi:hypothetical protein
LYALKTIINDGIKDDDDNNNNNDDDDDDDGRICSMQRKDGKGTQQFGWEMSNEVLDIDERILQWVLKQHDEDVILVQLTMVGFSGGFL